MVFFLTFTSYVLEHFSWWCVSWWYSSLHVNTFLPFLNLASLLCSLFWLMLAINLSQLIASCVSMLFFPFFRSLLKMLERTTENIFLVLELTVLITPHSGSGIQSKLTELQQKHCNPLKVKNRLNNHSILTNGQRIYHNMALCFKHADVDI